jgi:hypothetical protein
VVAVVAATAGAGAAEAAVAGRPDSRTRPVTMAKPVLIDLNVSPVDAMRSDAAVSRPRPGDQ